MSSVNLNSRPKSLQFLPLCGFALQTTAMFLAFYRPIQMDITSIAGAVSSPMSFLFSALVAIVFISLGIAHITAGRLAVHPLVIITTSAVCGGAIIFGATLPINSFPSIAIDFVARISMALLALSWLQVFARYRNETILQAIPSLLAFGFIVIMIAILAGPQRRVAAAVVLVALNAFWIIGALKFTGTNSPSGKTDAPDALETSTPPQTIAIDSESAAMRKRESKVGITTVLIGAFALSLLLGILCALPFAETGASLGNVTFLYFLLAMGATLLLLSLMSTLRRNRSTNKNEVRASILIPLGIVALAVGIALILQPHFPPLINAIGRLSMELSLIVGFLLAARYISSDPVQTSALGQAAFLIGNSLGVMIGLQLPNLFALHVDHLLVISIVITLVTSEALFVLAVLYQFACRSSTSSTASLKDTELQEGVAAKAKEPESSSVLDAFASHYALSNKESETLRLTVRGRSRQRIAEMLYVSPGTVNTYFYRIYQKTGVHTRQELLDLVEGFATARENNGTARNPQPADRANTETANY